MKKHFTNAGYGVLDYVSYPVGMLLVAPIVLHRLGAAEYGLWMISTAIISAGGIVASGFCDACTQRVAYLRGLNEIGAIPRAVRSMLAINTVLGATLAIGVWIAAPYAVPHIASSRLTSPAECLISLRIASALILVRAIESVGVSAHRAFEQYRRTVQISTAVRLGTLACAVVLTLLGQRIVSILIATGVFLALGTYMQFHKLRAVLGAVSLRPEFNAGETRILFGRGVFVWLQAVGSVVFGQLDRILLGTYLGALAVTPYSLCVQFAHPIYGLNASALNFLLPHLSGRSSSAEPATLRRTLVKAFACNLVLVTLLTAFLLLLGPLLIRLWAGPAVAHLAAAILPPIVLSSALIGLSVTGTYAMQALGLFRAVASISLFGRGAMLLLMIDMLHRHGLQGLALSRLAYGAVALLMYVPLIQKLNAEGRERKQRSDLATACEAREGGRP